MDRLTDSTTVLVVDDEPELADLYTKYLKSDYDVMTASGGEEALRKIDAEPDVVLLDRRMTDISGDRVLEEIRSRELDCRVIMVTAVSPEVDVIGMDFDDYLIKPVSKQMLRDAIERMQMRNTVDARLQEALRLASKMATIESKMDIEELERSPEYAELEAQLAEFRAIIEAVDPEQDLYAELSTEKMRSLFANRRSAQ